MSTAPMPHNPSPAFAEPIAAIATPPGVGGIAIVRTSGETVLEAVRPLLPHRLPPPDAHGRQCFYTVLRDPRTGARIDEAIVLAFAAPHSYTGEPVVEFQIHGGRQPARRLLAVLSTQGIRMALPGEFTQRAFLNGRIDLSQAEAVMDLISAQSDRAAHVAVEQLHGGLRRRIDPLYDLLTALCADLEASLDFPEDEVPDSMDPPRVARQVETLHAEISRLLATWREGHLLREGALVVLSGRPNAGKSALFNALLGQSRAIVAAQPGTTRDSIEEAFTLDGIPLRLTDTAGLRDTVCDIERQGVDRATRLLERADLHLRVIDLGDDATLAEIRELERLPAARTVVALNKADLHPPDGWMARLPRDYRAVSISALTGDGLPTLRSALQNALGISGRHADTDIAVNARHRDLLVRAAAALLRAHEQLTGPEMPEVVLVAQSLRDAAEALGTITGRNAGDDVLDQVFSRFCVGK